MLIDIVHENPCAIDPQKEKFDFSKTFMKKPARTTGDWDKKVENIVKQVTCSNDSLAQSGIIDKVLNSIWEKSAVLVFLKVLLHITGEFERRGRR